MNKIILILVFITSLYSSTILNYNIYNRTNRVDMMITFDTPYSGTIRQNRVKSKIIIF